jgi:hypothetical protein
MHEPPHAINRLTPHLRHPSHYREQKFVHTSLPASSLAAIRLALPDPFSILPKGRLQDAAQKIEIQFQSPD